MEKRIEYQGMTSQPSDYVCPDGDMKIAVNAEYRDGGWKAVKDVQNKCFDNKRIVYVHSTEERQIYIYISNNDKGVTLKAFENSVEVDFNDMDSFEEEKLVGIKNIGNILLVMIDGNILFFRLNEKNYMALKLNKDPLLISFAANRDFFFSDELNNYKQVYTIKKTLSGEINTFILSTTEYEKGGNKAADDFFWGPVLEMFADLKKRCSLVFPVLVRYALKMYDGNYFFVSPPILVYPFADTLEIEANEVEYRSPSYYGNNGQSSLYVKNPTVKTTSYKIAIKLEKSEIQKLEELNKSERVITGVDFFLSREFATYNTNYMCAYHDSNANNGINANKLYFKRKYQWYENLKKTDAFFRVKSYTIEELLKKSSDDDYFDLLEPEGYDNENKFDTLTNYEEGEVLKENSVYNFAIDACTYNNRVIYIGNKKNSIIGCNLSFFTTPIIYRTSTVYGYQNLDIPDEMSMQNLYVSSEGLSDFTILFKKQGFNYAIKIEKGGGSFFPLFYYISDANATDFIYKTTNEGKVYNYKFSEMDFISGAIMQSFYTSPNEDFNSIPELNKYEYVEGNCISLSVINNPFIYNIKDVLYVGNGSVLSLSHNSLPTSQGQFGQYPLYAFCTDGVYSIGIGDDGTLQNCVPLSYDILTDKHSVGKMEQVVVFATREGIIALSGSERKVLLSADKEATYSYDNDRQQAFIEKTLKDVVGITPPQMTNLYTYITTGVRFAFDANHGRLIAFNPAYDYSYIMDAKTNKWSVFNKGFDSVLNVPEQCLLVRKETNDDGETEYNVYDYSSDDVVDKQKSYFITRPFKLDMPDVHKSIQSIIQRGVFCDRKDVQQALYGSNDLYNWVPVWSSKDIYLRGMRGSGYKYYRMAIFIKEFKQNEILHGCSVEFTPRLTNKPR